MARERPDHVEVLAAEHRHVHDALTMTATGSPAGPEWRPRLTTALDGLRQHIAKEQDGLFPAAATSLSTEDWEAVEQVRDRVGSALRPAR